MQEIFEVARVNQKHCSTICWTRKQIRDHAVLLKPIGMKKKKDDVIFANEEDMYKPCGPGNGMLIIADGPHLEVSTRT